MDIFIAIIFYVIIFKKRNRKIKKKKELKGGAISAWQKKKVIYKTQSISFIYIISNGIMLIIVEYCSILIVNLSPLMVIVYQYFINYNKCITNKL